MAKKKTGTQSRDSNVDQADGERVGETTTDFMEVGQEVVPGMRLRCICRGHTGNIGRIAWSTCGRFIASPSFDKTIRIWDANDGKCLAMLRGHQAEVACVAWSPKGPLLASGGMDRALSIWNVAEVETCTSSGSPLEIHPTNTALDHSGMKNAHGDAVVALRWDPKGERLAAASQCQVVIWNFATGKNVQQMSAESCYVWDVLWSADGARVIACDAGGASSSMGCYKWPIHLDGFVGLDKFMSLIGVCSE
ncbi:MAG: hypothetical protein AABP62_05130 [Planctomycetota bacterium]